MTYVHPQLITAHAQLISAPRKGLSGPTAAVSAKTSPGKDAAPRTVSVSSGSAAPAADPDYKVTGKSIFNRPDDESQWDPGNGGRWIRRWLPGEKEAEAQKRIGMAQNEVLAQRFDYRLSAEQKNEIAKINTALEDARRSGRFTPEELNELERQADARRLGIKPLPVPHEDTAQESFDKRIVEANGVRGWLDSKGDFQPFDGGASAADVYGGTHVDENGRRWGVDKSGKLYEVGGGKDEFAEIMKMVPTQKEVVDPMTKKVSLVDLTPEERLAEAEKLREMRDKFNGVGRQPAGTAGIDGGFGYEQLMQMMDPMFAYKQQPLIRQIVAEQSTQQEPAAPAPTPAPTPVTPAPASVQAAPEDPNDPMAKYRKYKRSK